MTATTTMPGTVMPSEAVIRSALAQNIIDILTDEQLDGLRRDLEREIHQGADGAICDLLEAVEATIAYRWVESHRAQAEG